MKPLRAWAAAVTLAVAVGLLPGCGSAPTATVSGSVTYDGQPVGEGYVTFTPSDGKGKEAGGPIANGQYSLAGLQPGPKLVKVIAVKKVSFASTSAEMQQKAAVAQKAGNYDGLVDPADTIPDNAEGNNVTIEVKAGEQTRDLHLKKPSRGR
jgi:hypothetical protein